MAPRTSFSFTLAMHVVLALLLQATSLVADDVNGFPDYTYRHHPLFTLPHFENFTTQPVIMRKYFFYYDGFRNSERAIFVPGGATYAKYSTTVDPADTPQLLLTNADVLAIPHIHLYSSNRVQFAEVQLNHRARIFVIVDAPKFIRGTDSVNSVRGVPADWVLIDAVRLQSDPALGEDDRWEEMQQPMLPDYGAMFEVPLPADLVLKLPHPMLMRINGVEGVRLNIVFVPVSARVFPVTGFAAPLLPGSFRAPLNRTVRVNPSEDAPTPNTVCPEWLHDLHVTPDIYTHSTRLYWQTWHTMIDPIYWCYYDHEHGAYPGNYRPKFHYTPSRTPDKTSPTGSQIESHRGFKIFAFRQPKDGRVVVAVLHMHLSLARRFVTRFHTFVLSVHRVVTPGRWVQELELQMKMDFGPAMVRFSNLSREPFNSEGFAVKKEINDRMRKAGRLFNVLNVDGSFPSSLDKRIQMRGDERKGPYDVMLGFYEKWTGPLNTCSMSDFKFNGGLVFDVRDPQTAMRTIESGMSAMQNMQELRGPGKSRLLIVNEGEVKVAEKYCEFDNVTSVSALGDRGPDGVFFTDPYMSEIVAAGTEVGKVRQFMKHGFEELVMEPGYVTTEDPWTGLMSYGPQDNRNVEHLERSYDIMKN